MSFPKHTTDYAIFLKTERQKAHIERLIWEIVQKTLLPWTLTGRVCGICQDIRPETSDATRILRHRRSSNDTSCRTVCNIAARLNCHACQAQALRCGASVRTSALANWHRKLRHSSDHLPVPSSAKTTSFVLPELVFPLGICCLLPLSSCLQSCSIRDDASRMWRPVPCDTETTIVSTSSLTSWNICILKMCFPWRTTDVPLCVTETEYVEFRCSRTLQNTTLLQLVITRHSTSKQGDTSRLPLYTPRYLKFHHVSREFFANWLRRSNRYRTVW